MSDDAPIVQDVLPGSGGRNIGTLMLNVPATLNSLTLEMVDLLQGALDSWRDDESIAAIFIYSGSDKAFCAGGDVHALHESSVATPGGPCEYAESFFTREYRMNHALHTYSKPIICWGHGIVMGGGLGVFAGCSQRVVTERTRFAMPEITIALFPDVGGSYFLNQMPGQAGRFLALTAANFNARDGMDTGYGTAMLPNSARQAVVDGLQALSWSLDDKANHEAVDALLASLASQHPCEEAPEGNLLRHSELIEQLCSGTTQQVYANIAALETEDKWLSRARDGLLHGSPLAALWIDRQLQLAKPLNLADALRSEILLATNIVRHPEFAEGVRALLIDKDKSPQWQYSSIDAVPAEALDAFFQAPWSENPLADL